MIRHIYGTVVDVVFIKTQPVKRYIVTTFFVVGKLGIICNHQAVGCIVVLITFAHDVEIFFRTALIDCQKFRSKGCQQILKRKIQPQSRHKVNASAVIDFVVVQFGYCQKAPSEIAQEVIEDKCFDIVIKQCGANCRFTAKAMADYGQS